MRTTKITKSDIQAYIRTHALDPDNMGSALDSRKNYSGPDLGVEWIGAPVGRNRDSDNMANSNFDTALEILGGERAGKVEVFRIGSWLCGWAEYIGVHRSNHRGLRTCVEIRDLLETEALLDDSDYYERQSNDMAEMARESWTQNQVRKLLASATDAPAEVIAELDVEDFALDIIQESESYTGEIYWDERALGRLLKQPYDASSKLFEAVAALNGFEVQS